MWLLWRLDENRKSILTLILYHCPFLSCFKILTLILKTETTVIKRNLQKLLPNSSAIFSQVLIYSSVVSPHVKFKIL